MRDYACKLRRLSKSGVWNEKPKNRGRGLLKSSGGKRRRHENERLKSAEWKRRNVGGTKKRKGGKKRRRSEREKRQKQKFRQRGRGKEKFSQGHNFRGSTSASTKRNSCKSLWCLTEKIQSELQNEIESKNLRSSWLRPRSVKQSTSVIDRSG